MSSNEELVTMIRNGIDRDRNIERLYFQNLGLIKKAANRFRSRAEFNDLIQEGFFAVLHAVELYDPEAGASFATYLFGWLRQAMSRYVEQSGSCLRLPSHRQQRILKYKKTVNLFQMEWNRMPTAYELSKALELTEDQIEEVKADIEALKVKSMNAPISDEDQDAEYGDFIPDQRDSIAEVEDAIQNEELADLLWSIVDGLEAREAVVIKKRFKEGKTLHDCAADLDVSPERIRMIQAKALRKLRLKKNADQLRSFYDGEIASMAVKGVGANTFQRTWTSATERAVLIMESRKERLEKQYG